MTRTLPSLALLLGLAACASGAPKIREVGAVHADRSDGTTAGRLALGYGHLRLNNVALALETFRRAAREDPSSAEALVGIAECYQRMGRPVLARTALEQALALRAEEPGLYRALAQVSAAEGKLVEAAALEREAARRSAPQPISPGSAKPAPSAPVAVAQAVPSSGPSMTIALPPPRPAPPASPVAPAAQVRVTLPPAQPTDSGPRLVRLSPGEVMLVSRSGSPFAHREVAANTDDTIHAPLRILNAARIEGVAARTRALLAARGVRDARIGNAPGRRDDSEIRFAARERAAAERIAARLPFAVRRVVRDGPLVLLIGRNAGRKG